MTTFLARHSVALVAALAFASAQAQDDTAHCQYPELASLALRYAGTGLRPVVDGTINRRRAVLSINSASFADLLSMTGAARFRLPLRDNHKTISGSGGPASVYTAVMDEFSFGRYEAGRVAMAVIGETTSPDDVDGYLGAGFLFQADLEFNLANKQLKLFKPHDCGKAPFLAYWDPNAMTVTTSEYQRTGKIPHFTVELNGRRLDAIVASASPRTVVSLAAARRAGFVPSEANKSGEADAIGTSRAMRWQARFDKLSIGAENIDHPSLLVEDSAGSSVADIELGVDFLRTHRLLFARSQRRLYISYLGGDVFPEPGGIEPWIQGEADNGNPDAEFAVAVATDRSTPQGKASANAWFNKAVAHGQPQANLQAGRFLLESGRYADAAVRLRTALDKHPLDRFGALWLYLARTGSNAESLGRQELENMFQPPEPATLAGLFGKAERPWPEPIVDFFLGRINADALLAHAAHQNAAREARLCQAYQYIGLWHMARKDIEGLASLHAKATASGNDRCVPLALQAPPPLQTSQVKSSG